MLAASGQLNGTAVTTDGLDALVVELIAGLENTLCVINVVTDEVLRPDCALPLLDCVVEPDDSEATIDAEVTTVRVEVAV